MKQFLGSVLHRFEVEEIWILVDKLSIYRPIQELIITQHVLEERDVCLGREKRTDKYIFN